MRLRTRVSLALLVGGLCAFLAGSSLDAGEKKAKGKKAVTANTLKVGDRAPQFEATDDEGKAWKSSEHVGKKVVVLFFFPAALTGGWTNQACGFRDETPNLGKNVEVVGISGDKTEGHQLFKKEQDLNFTLLSDENGKIAQKFGIPTKAGGAIKYKGQDLKRGVTISRYTVVIDRDGTIAAIDPVTDAKGDAKRVAAIVKKLEAN